MTTPTNTKIEEILRDAFTFYLGERKDVSFDCEPLIEYAVPLLTQALSQREEEVLKDIKSSIPLRSDWDDDVKVTAQMIIDTMHEVVDEKLQTLTKD
jgi:hypothetical protein